MEKESIVLLVDDNLDQIDLVELALLKQLKSLQIVKAFAAHSCLKIVQEMDLDLIVLDYSLPDQNGLEVLQSIKNIDPDLPVLMLTGHGNEQVAADALKKGAYEYIVKSEGSLNALPIIVSRILVERTEKQRRKTAELYYRDLVENSNDGVYLLDERGNIRLVNNVCAQVTGYNKRKLIGCHFSFLFEENEYKQLLNKVRKDRRLRRLVQYRTFIKCKSKDYVPVELSVIPVKKNRKLIGYQGIVRDISERLESEKEQLRKSIEIQQINDELVRQNKKLQELHELKSQFVSNVGHELRTPLNGVLGYAELLKEGIYGSLSMEQNRALKQIINSGNHLLNLINELLDFAKIQSGKFKVYKDYGSVDAIVDAAIATVQPSLESKKLDLIRSVEPGLPRIFMDSQKIHQVLLNILSNSIKFTSEGEIELKIYKNGEMIRFSVRDTGIGISESEIEKIFMDFHQVDGSFTRSYGGTGLGLSLAKYLIEAHNGEIWVESVPGSGSTFSFEIPVHDPESDIIRESGEISGSEENKIVTIHKQVVEK